jgi:hypothetical protein
MILSFVVDVLRRSTQEGNRNVFLLRDDSWGVLVEFHELKGIGPLKVQTHLEFC